MAYGFKKRKIGSLALKEMSENNLPYDEIPKWMQEEFLMFYHEIPESVIVLGNGIYKLDLEFLERNYGF